MINRRKLLNSITELPFVVSFVGIQEMSAQTSVMKTVGTALERDFFKELGLRTFINAAGTYTSMTGWLKPTEVTDAIGNGETEYVNLDDLQDTVGELIAELLTCEYSTVTSGCFGTMSLAMS